MVSPTTGCKALQCGSGVHCIYCRVLNSANRRRSLTNYSQSEGETPTLFSLLFSILHVDILTLPAHYSTPSGTLIQVVLAGYEVAKLKSLHA
jgi:hypothetical protein